MTTQRDWGNRTDRKNAKTKYTLERVGVDVFRAEVEKRAGITFAPIRPYEFTGRGDRIGWVKGIDDRWHLTLFIENGRLLDYPGRPLKTGMAEIAKIHKGDFRLTANQNVIIAGVPESEKAKIESLARDHGLIDDEISEQRKNSMACVSFPTCPLAMAEAERFLPQFVTKVEGIMHRHGVGDEHIVLRITGCPNGCGARCWRSWGWWARRSAAITCIWAATAKARAFRACTARTSTKTRSWARSTYWWGAGRRSATPAKASATSPFARASSNRCWIRRGISGSETGRPLGRGAAGNFKQQERQHG